jgi:hypothetical protein
MNQSTAQPAPTPEPSLGHELRASALLLGMSFGVTAVVVTVAQAAASLLA